MQIAHVVRQYLPSLGGLEEVVRNLVQQQLQAGHTPYIITLDRIFKDAGTLLPAEELIEGIKVIRIPFVGSSRYPIAPSVLKYLAPADLVHVHAIDFFYDFLAFTKFLHRKPMVVTTHGGFFHTGYASTLKRIYFKTITRLSAQAYERVIGCSDNDGAMFSQILTPPKLCVIENGVDITKFNSAAATEKQPTLIYFGRWSINKGLYQSLDVLAALREKTPGIPWKMIICGRAYDLTEVDLLNYANGKGVEDYVEVISNPSNADIREKVGQASYYICLSKHEGFGIAPIEAMSAGLYPLLSDIPPFEKLVAQTKVGLILKSKDATQVASEIYKLHQAERVERAAIISAVEPYAWANVSQSYNQEYLKSIQKD